MYSTQYIFLFLLSFTGSETVVSPFQLYNISQQSHTRAKRSAQVPLQQTNKKKLLPSVTQIYKFAVTPTCYNA